MTLSWLNEYLPTDRQPFSYPGLFQYYGNGIRRPLNEMQPCCKALAGLTHNIFEPAIRDEPNYGYQNIDQDRQPGTDKGERNSGDVEYR